MIEDDINVKYYGLKERMRALKKVRILINEEIAIVKEEMNVMDGK